MANYRKPPFSREQLNTLFYITENGELFRRVINKKNAPWMTDHAIDVWNAKANKPFYSRALEYEGFRKSTPETIKLTMLHGADYAQQKKFERMAMGQVNGNHSHKKYTAIEPYISINLKTFHYRVQFKKQTGKPFVRTFHTLDEARRFKKTVLMQERQIFDKPTTAGISIHTAPTKETIETRIKQLKTATATAETTEPQLNVNYQQPVTLYHDYNADLYPRDFAETSANALVQSFSVYG